MAGDASKLWHLSRNGEKFGTFTSQQLGDMGKEGRITSDMLVWREGMEKWQPVSKVKGLQVVTAAAAPPPAPASPLITVAVSPAPSAAPMPVSGHVTIEKTSKSLKSQQLLGLLCIVLGITIMGIGASGDGQASKEPSSLAMMGASLFLIGIAWRVVTRYRIWWHHG
jgi:hypothetical protein